MVLTWFGFNSGDRDAGTPQWSTPQKPDDLATFPVSLPIGNPVENFPGIWKGSWGTYRVRRLPSAGW